MSIFASNQRILNKRLAPSYTTKKLSNDAAVYMNLYYLILMKKLTTASYSTAFKKGRTTLTSEDLETVSPDLLKDFSHTHRISRQWRHKTSRGSTSSSRAQSESSTTESEESPEGSVVPSEEGSVEPSEEGSVEESDEFSDDSSEEVMDQPSNENAKENDFVDDGVVSETDDES